MKLVKRYEVTFYLFGEPDNVFSYNLELEIISSKQYFSKSLVTKRFFEQIKGFNKEKIIIVSID